MIETTLIILALLIGFLFIGWGTETPNLEVGATFSRPYARDELKLDADKVLTAALDELNIRRFRIPAYWKFIEPQPDAWTFEELDADIASIKKRGGHVTLALGEKLPRWPECWGPDWWKKIPHDEQRIQTLQYLRTVVTRYRGDPTIVSWQIENEPHFAYGDCPIPEKDFLDQEISLVRQLDPTRPVVTTDSGELSLWVTFGTSVDELGVSVYRIVQNPKIGIWSYWFIPPYFYERKALLLKPLGLKKIFVSEFQMEPWSNKPLPETSIDDQLKTMNEKRMKKNFDYATKMGVSPVDFWGVEWWYWMKEKNRHPEFWETAKEFFSSRI